MIILKGTPDTLVKRVVDHVSLVDPDWRGKIRPADRALLARYVKASRLEARGLELPANYRVFAEAMGGGCGRLFDALKISSGLEEIVELYEEYDQFQPAAIRADLPIVAKHVMGTQISLDLQHAGEPTVVETTDFDCAEFLASSWEHFLLQAATLYVELRRLPRGLWCARSELAGPAMADALNGLDAIVSRRRLVKSWLCDQRHYIAVSEDASIYGELSLDGALFLRVFAGDDSSLRSLGDEIAVEVGAERRGQLQRADGVLRT